MIYPELTRVRFTKHSDNSYPTDPYPPPLDLLLTELTGVSRRSARVFLHGVGRESLMLKVKAFAMCLFHLGLSSHLVSDVTTSPISSLDLLIASAGPGGFSTVNVICSIAKSCRSNHSHHSISSGNENPYISLINKLTLSQVEIELGFDVGISSLKGTTKSHLGRLKRGAKMKGVKRKLAC
ncbi:hypothetical protein HID58_032427 [Brassica napus]|uniref:Uncharacterized protein n=1 Tax=Brassica napus TaxID=3708 RepID=A0ABQ8BWA9_BRANA|nr:hypothetical protein HID58_032427 [Brassica napus]